MRHVFLCSFLIGGEDSASASFYSEEIFFLLLYVFRKGKNNGKNKTGTEAVAQ